MAQNSQPELTVETMLCVTNAQDKNKDNTNWIFMTLHRHTKRRRLCKLLMSHSWELITRTAYSPESRTTEYYLFLHLRDTPFLNNASVLRKLGIMGGGLAQSKTGKCFGAASKNFHNDGRMYT